MFFPTIPGFLFAALLLGTVTLSAQQTLTLDPAATTITASGTSTFAKWEMPLQDGRCSGSATFIFGAGGLAEVTALRVQLEAEGLRSNKKGMNKDAYAALKTDEHPYLTFEMTSVQRIEQQAGGYLVEVAGDLSLAGVSRTVNLQATCTVGDAGSVTCTGSYTLNMTDYGVEPPTAMLGTVRAGEEVTVEYRAVFRP